MLPATPVPATPPVMPPAKPVSATPPVMPPMTPPHVVPPEAAQPDTPPAAPPEELQSTEDEEDFSFIRDPDELRDEELMQKISDELMNTIEEVKHMNMSDRPKLIKFTENIHFKDLLKRVDHILQNLIPTDIPLMELNYTHFGAALYIQRKIVPDYDEKRPRNTQKSNKDHPWKIKLQKKIQKLRTELSLLSRTTHKTLSSKDWASQEKIQN